MAKRTRRTTVDAVQARFARDAEYRRFASPEQRQAKPVAPRRRPRTIDAGPVTVWHADGSQTAVAALTDQELQAIVRVRAITPASRTAVAKRDGWRCRYCGTGAGPFEVDHVLPVSLGGSNRIGNLVWACDQCNRRKGAAVWKPVTLAAHWKRRATDGWISPSTRDQRCVPGGFSLHLRSLRMGRGPGHVEITRITRRVNPQVRQSRE